MIDDTNIFDESKLRNPFEYAIGVISLRYRRFPNEIEELGLEEISRMLRYIMKEKKDTEEQTQNIKGK
jgi:hypothetical protein